MSFLQPPIGDPCVRSRTEMNCPFCGVSADVAHETQEACIEALNAEIKRVREILHHVRSSEVPGLPRVDKNDDAAKPVRRPNDA